MTHTWVVIMDFVVMIFAVVGFCVIGIALRGQRTEIKNR